jgi:Tat protein secretion system quality control protein TatD with DNase activity
MPLLLTSLTRCMQVGIGEVGLDFSPHVLKPKGPDNSSTSTSTSTSSSTPLAAPSTEGLLLSEEDLKEVQRGVFQQQVLLANELALPVNVHSRSAGHHAVRAVCLKAELPSNCCDTGRVAVAVAVTPPGELLSVWGSCCHVAVKLLQQLLSH